MANRVPGRALALVLFSLVFVIPVVADDTCEAFIINSPAKLDDDGGKKILEVPNGLHLRGRYASPRFGLFEFKAKVQDGKHVEDVTLYKGRQVTLDTSGVPTKESLDCLQKAKPVASFTTRAAEWLLLTALDLASGRPAYAVDNRNRGCANIRVTITCYGDVDSPGRTCVAHHYCGREYRGYLTVCTGNECPGRAGPKGRNRQQ